MALAQVSVPLQVSHYYAKGVYLTICCEVEKIQCYLRQSLPSVVSASDEMPRAGLLSNTDLSANTVQCPLAKIRMHAYSTSSTTDHSSQKMGVPIRSSYSHHPYFERRKFVMSDLWTRCAGFFCWSPSGCSTQASTSMARIEDGFAQRAGWPHRGVNAFAYIFTVTAAP